RWNIAPHHILAHQDIAPYRKFDPGVNFDWAGFARKGIGAWHDLEPVENDPVIDDKTVHDAFKKNMALYGYDTRPAPEGREFSEVIRAFQTHFLPWNICGQVTGQSVQALDILLENKLS
ncbi:MAG: N-acetylmuramyl-L-alanine amidase, negative regulator of AmpC, AmpD, partial [Alphaproteobacteria bacterium]|nr:N-acetylmuramyl-L-alanine amidase, negative regulator of AmpC, AmpD [Alphaproteobacteria bacterium]